VLGVAVERRFPVVKESNGARSVPVNEVRPPSDDDAYGLRLKKGFEKGGAFKEEDLRRFLGAASARSARRYGKSKSKSGSESSSERG
jgi:hypothetical protein